MNENIKQKLIITFLFGILTLFFYSVRSILLPFVLGIIIAYLLGRTTSYLESKFKSRKIASFIVISSFTLVIIIFFIFIIPILLNQLINLLKELGIYLSKNNDKISEVLNNFINYFELQEEVDVKKYIAGYANSITKYILGILNDLLSRSFAVLSILSLLIITPITAFYFLNEWNNIIRVVRLYIPRKNKKKIDNLFSQIDSVLSGCLRGQLNVCMLLGTFYGTLLFMSGLRYGFVIGLLTGLASFVPYFGMFIGFFIALIMTFYQFGFDTAHIIITIFIFMLGQFLEGNFITPKLVGSKIHLHPLWIIFALFSGATLFGFVGLLISLPIAGIIGVLIRFYIKETIKYRK